MAIVGPTASGKSALAMTVAERTGAEILSVDSMQVYRGMDVGTAKPDLDARRRVPHHMIDIVEPEVRFTVADFRQAARRALDESSGQLVLIVGGSGLHFRAVVDAMTFRPTDPRVRRRLGDQPLDDLVSELLAADPDAERHIDLSNPRRVIRSVEALRVSGLTPSEWAASSERRSYDAYRPELPFLGFAVDRADLDERVERRLGIMRRAGFLGEVERLAPRMGPTASQAVGYRQLLDVVEGRSSETEGFEAAKRATMRLVKQQRTFFRRDPRLRWVDGADPVVPDVITREMAR